MNDTFSQGLQDLRLHRILRALALSSTAGTFVELGFPAVQTSNTEALNFYARFGFTIKDTIKNYYKRIDPPDCHVLVKAFPRDAKA